MTDVSAFEAALAPWDRPARGGVAAGVVQGGQVVFRGEVGFANLEHSVRVYPGTRFQIASLSKQFLGALALLLSDAGHLQLDDDVRQASPLLHQYPNSITLRQLLSHTSGLVDTFDVLTLAGAKVETPVSKDTIAELFRKQRHLNFATGEGFAYSNGGFEIAASIIEDVMGSSLAALYDRHLFGPIGMTRTVLINRDNTVVEGEASGYLVHEGEAKRGTHGIPFNGGAGILSTLDDMLLWERYLLGNGTSLLSRMETPPAFSNGAKNLYGLGTYVDKWRGLNISGHGGLLPGFVAQVVRCSAEGTSVVVLSNSSDVDSNGLARGMLKAALSGRGSDSGQQAQIAAGRYFDAAKNELFEVQHVGQKVWALTHGWRVPLTVQPDHSIVFDDPLLDGRLVGSDYLELVEWGQKWPLRRIIPSQDAEAGLDRFIGDFSRDDIPTLLRFSRPTQGLTLSIQGAFGSANYRLERVDDDLFLGRSPAGTWMPLELLIRFFDSADGPATSIKITTDRTKGIVFSRNRFGAAPWTLE